MKLELLRAYKHMLGLYGPGRAARLMRLTCDEEREALAILRLNENNRYADGEKDERRPLDGAGGPHQGA